MRRALVIPLISTAVAVGLIVSAPAREPCTSTASVVTVEFSKAKYPHLTDHISDVRQRYDKVLTIDRQDDDANHRATEPFRHDSDPTTDGDEYPPAMFGEGGKGADIRFIPSSENRSAGSYMGRVLSQYCNGTHVRLVVVP